MIDHGRQRAILDATKIDCKPNESARQVRFTLADKSREKRGLCQKLCIFILRRNRRAGIVLDPRTNLVSCGQWLVLVAAVLVCCISVNTMERRLKYLLFALAATAAMLCAGGSSP